MMGDFTRLPRSALTIPLWLAFGGCAPPASPPATAPPKGSLAMRVTAAEFQWRIRYPGPDEKLDTSDDVLARRHLHLPAETRVAIDLRSEDYVYSFFLPHIDLMEVAVPDIPFELVFETATPGIHELLGSQMCGYTHPELLGDVVIHTPNDFETWLSGVRE